MWKLQPQQRSLGIKQITSLAILYPSLILSPLSPGAFLLKGSCVFPIILPIKGGSRMSPRSY